MDYYGDFSRCETQPRTNASTALMRANTTKQQRANSESNYLCAIATCLALRAIFAVFIIGSLYYLFDARHNILLVIGIFECATMISVLLVYFAVGTDNPFFCVPYVVLRTVEFFLWGVLVFTCAYATLRPNSEYFTEAYSIVRNGWNYTPFTNIRLNLIDLTATLCSIVMLAAIIALGLSGEAMRHAWATTARVADAHRRAKRSPLGDGETRRIMVSSDEFNYA